MKKILIGIFIVLVLVLSFKFVNALNDLSNPHLHGKSAPNPVVTLNGKKVNYHYESFCWNEFCSEKKHTPPSVDINYVKVGDIIEVDWKNFKDKPNVISLHNITTGKTKDYHLEDNHIKIDVSKQISNTYEYEVIFQWYIGKSSDLKGKSYLTFNVKTN